MLKRTLHSNSVVTYQSPLLAAAGIVHAFSTRIGGVSAAPFNALNLGNPGEGPRDADANLRENFRRLQEAIGAAKLPRAWVRQVHGGMVELIEREPENEYAETLEAELRDRFSGQLAADGLVAAVPKVLLTVRVADCVPILLATQDGHMVAAVHAGWRGVVGNILGRAVRAMHEAGAEHATADKVIAAIGPAISVEHFEVGEEVAAEFVRQDLAEAVHTQAGRKPHVDLQFAVKMQLERAGVSRIDTNDRCSFRDAEEFFSHRRDNGTTGRMVGVIAARR